MNDGLKVSKLKFVNGVRVDGMTEGVILEPTTLEFCDEFGNA